MDYEDLEVILMELNFAQLIEMAKEFGFPIVMDPELEEDPELLFIVRKNMSLN